MSYAQTITPTPDIDCKPGYCLQYVRQTFGLPARYASATEAWENSPSQHTGLDFPEGVCVPVWFGIETVPEGHVVLRMSDGSIYSTSDNSTVPHHHPSLSDLIGYYSYYGLPLTYRGWTEDVAGYTVITPGGLSYQSETITPLEEIDVSAAEDILARITETVSWQDAQFREIRETAESNRNALAGFVRDVVNAKETITPAEIDAKFAELATAGKATSGTLFKGDTEATVYAWDASTGFRALTWDEYLPLATAGAVVSKLPQGIIDKAVGK